MVRRILTGFLLPESSVDGHPLRPGFQPHLSIGNLQPNDWTASNGVNVSEDEPFASGKLANELSLSLATSQPSVMDSRSIPDQCSDITCNHAARHFSKETRKVLAQIASYSLENLDQVRSSTAGFKTGASTLFSSSYAMEGGAPPMGFDKSPGLDVQMDPALQKRALEAKRTQLLALLQLVDERYSQCLDEIHTVISAFHAATELDPQIHTRFALQTISLLYKQLRERISNQILAMGSHLDSGDTIETEGSVETSYLQKQWTLQQLKKNDHQLWRPQRGLPERSVSVLRAWMFQNFLHPYPKDAEKHLLAVKKWTNKKPGIKLVYKCSRSSMETNDRGNVCRDEQKKGSPKRRGSQQKSQRPDLASTIQDLM
ncbi:hypothetical protein OIU84_000393 [Salix udensis]|uniref:POX domain-containing protein n=1 Tax=Salix udensis TaxID=889485 RepID=A0AAD6PN32_9ROSI|nr:hypothetical protein OIU84_000393 [Salix udensis]KAJ6435160.1 hypothetical protein OIU84_000393 [Salix udensis]KAJ6435161.1 hypothetical protein OIU84_000393 [Salix udensis]